MLPKEKIIIHTKISFFLKYDSYLFELESKKMELILAHSNVSLYLGSANGSASLLYALA